MLKHISNMAFLLCLIAMSSFWTLGLIGRFAMPLNPQQQSVEISGVAQTSSVKETPPASVQDVSAETVALYTKVLACFAFGLFVVTALQVWLLYKADTTARRSLEFADRQSAMIHVQQELERMQRLTPTLATAAVQPAATKVGNGGRPGAYVVQNPRPVIENNGRARGHWQFSKKTPSPLLQRRG
jgi:hypothetical protein